MRLQCTLNVFRALRVLGLLTLLGNFQIAYSALPGGKDCLDLLLPVQIYVFKSMRCYENVHCLLGYLANRDDFNLKEAKVLYVAPHEIFNFHVLLLYRGHILDPREMGARNIVLPLAVSRYFVGKKLTPKAYVRMIPAEEYLRDFGSIGYERYLHGMPGYTHKLDPDQIIQMNDLYPKMSLKKFLKEQATTVSGQDLSE